MNNLVERAKEAQNLIEKFGLKTVFNVTIRRYETTVLCKYDELALYKKVVHSTSDLFEHLTLTYRENLITPIEIAACRESNISEEEKNNE